MVSSNVKFVKKQTLRDRIIEAAYACTYESGISKLTLEDVAKQAGTSRATIYRYFPKGRDQLVSEVVAWAAFIWLEGLVEAISGIDDFEEIGVKAIMFAHKSLLNHDLLQKVLDEEPQVILPLLTVEASRIVAFVHLYVVTRLFGKTLPEHIDRDTFAEYMARLLVSTIVTPGRWDLSDERQVRDLVRCEFMAPLTTGR